MLTRFRFRLNHVVAIIAVAAGSFSWCCQAQAIVVSGYADSVVAYNNPDAAATISVPSAALGAPDGLTYSLGRLGWIELHLSAPVIDLPGPDFEVWEEGWPNGAPDEKAHVYLSLDGNDWTFIGNVLRNVPSSIYLDIAGKGVDGATFVKVEDFQASFFQGTPGFDLDGVVVYSGDAAVPEPLTATLGLLGLASLMMRRRRRMA